MASERKEEIIQLEREKII